MYPNVPKSTKKYQKVSQKYHKSITKFHKSILKVSQKYPKRIQNVSKKYQKSIRKKVFKCNLNVSQKYPKSIPKVSQNYFKSNPKVFQKSPKSIPKVLQNYPKSTFTNTQSLRSCEFSYKSLESPDNPTDRQTRNEKPLRGHPLLGRAFLIKKNLRINCRSCHKHLFYNCHMSLTHHYPIVECSRVQCSSA